VILQDRQYIPHNCSNGILMIYDDRVALSFATKLLCGNKYPDMSSPYYAVEFDERIAYAGFDVINVDAR